MHYDHRAVGDEPLGHIVENRLIRGALLRRVADAARLARWQLAAPERWARIERRADAADVALAERAARPGPPARRRRGARLADRATLAGIEVLRWDYRQTGIVATLAHAEPHRGLAVERFFPDRPARDPADDRAALVDRLGGATTGSRAS